MKNFEYILTNNKTLETVILAINPAGWKELGTTWLRSDVYNSLLRSKTLSLRFLNITLRNGGTGGYQFLLSAYNADGIYADVTCQINRYNPNTNNYTYLEYVGKCDFSPEKFTDEVGLFIQLPIIDSSKLQKFIARDENEINLLSSQSIDGDTLPALTTQSIILTPVSIVVKDISTCPTGLNSPLNNGDIYYWYLDNPAFTRHELTNSSIGGTELIYTNNYDYQISIFFSLSIAFSYSMAIVSGSAGKYTFGCGIIHYNDSAVEIERQSIIIGEYTHPSGSGTYTLTGTNSLQFIGTMAAGDYLEFRFNVTNSATSLVSSVSIYDSYSVGITENIPGQPENMIECLFPFEAFERGKQILTGDSTNIIESTVMGRTACSLKTYPANGELAFFANMSGRMIREYPNAAMNVKFRDMFLGYYCRTPIGLGYDKVNDRFYIETLDKFYDTSFILFNLGNVKNLKKVPLPSAYYSKIIAGYDNKGTYKKISGANEFNVAREYSTQCPVKEEKNIRCKLRFDSVAAEELRSMPYIDAASEDSDYDNEFFVVETDADGGRPVLASSMSVGSDIFGTYYNTTSTPRQNAVRHGVMLSACHYKKGSSKFKAQRTEKEFDLVIDGNNENSDIDISETPTSYITPEMSTFESTVTPAMIAAMDVNPHGLVVFYYEGVEYQEFIHKLQLGDYNGMATFETIPKGYSSGITGNYRIFEDGTIHQFEDNTLKELE